LRQETGWYGGRWTSHGSVFPLPALTPARVHLWSAQELEAGSAQPEPSERDIRVVALNLLSAVEAVHRGEIRCAASAALLLLLAAGQPR
jgi:ADP-ribose pyrophosphatase